MERMMNKDREFMIASAVRDATRRAAYVDIDDEGNMEVRFDVIDLRAIIAAIQTEPASVTKDCRDAEHAAALHTDQRQNRRPALLVYSTPGSDWLILFEPTKLSNPVRVGGVNFHKGVGVDRVIRHAEHQYKWWKEARDAGKTTKADGCGACGDACAGRGACRLDDESPHIEQPAPALTDEELHSIAATHAMVLVNNEDQPEQYEFDPDTLRNFAKEIEARVKGGA